MPTGLFRKEGERWVINLPNPPASANAYLDDHARLLVRYMLQMTPDEQRRLLATAPVATPAATPAQAPAQGARIKSKGRRGELTFNKAPRRKRPAMANNLGAPRFARPAGM